MRYYEKQKERDYIIEIHIADIHFGCIDPYTEYKILEEQFLSKITPIDFDILSIDGDIFDTKFMANTDAVYYAMKFVKACKNLCASKFATFIIIAGTQSHDAGQIRLFAEPEGTDLDMRLVEQARFEYVQGLKILCIPEEYGKGKEYYENLLYGQGLYDTAFMHGTVVGSVYGANNEDLNSRKYPIFSINNFTNCKGPIICGHVHKAMCLNGYIYYCSNPIRYKFGEEEEKGFLIVMHNTKNSMHTTNFIPIKSFRYDTIDITTLQYSDPNLVIQYLDNLLANGVDNIRVDFSNLNNDICQKIIEEYYVNNKSVSIKRYTDKTPKVNTTEEIENKYSDLGFLLNPEIDPYNKFVAFINHNKGENFITVDKLKAILSDKTLS